MRKPVNEASISGIAKGAAAGAQALGRALGSKAAGATTANAMNKLSQGAPVGKNLLTSVAPYAEIIGEILADPRYRALFMKLINTIKADKARLQARQPAQQESIQMKNTNESQRLSRQAKDAREEINFSLENILEVLPIAKLPNAKNAHTMIMQLMMMVDPDMYESVDGELNAPADAVDTVTLDIPLMIRMLEFAKEDAVDDMALHDVAEKLIALSKEADVLTMDQYDSIVGLTGEAEPGSAEPVQEAKTVKAPAPEHNGYVANLDTQHLVHNGREIANILPVSMFGDDYEVSTFNNPKDEAEWQDYCDSLSSNEVLEILVNHQLAEQTTGRNKSGYTESTNMKNKKSIKESLAYGYQSPEAQDTQKFNYNASKQIGDSKVDVNIQSTDMEELHRLIKLAGLENFSDSADTASAVSPVTPNQCMPGPELEFRVSEAMESEAEWDRYGLTIDDYEAIWNRIEQAVAQAVPDVDIIDAIVPWLRKYGVPNQHLEVVADNAAKKNGFDSIHDYYDYINDTGSYPTSGPTMEASDDEADGQVIDGDLYVVIEDDEKVFVGKISQEDSHGKWHESSVAGKPPKAWGGRTYGSHLSHEDILNWLNSYYDFVEGPFDTAETAKQWALSHIDIGDFDNQKPPFDSEGNRSELRYSTDANQITESLKRKMRKKLK